MRRTWRAIGAALISSTAVAAAALLASPLSAQAAAGPATPVPPGPNSALAGTWVNTNGATKNVVDLVVGTSAKGITVDGFGACSPQACQLPRSAGLSRAGIRSSMTADAPWQARSAAWPRGARPR
jgi:hypothetical protein